MTISKYLSILKTSDIIYLIVFCLLSIMARGYEYGTNDQVIYIPVLNKLTNSQLYPHDYIFPLSLSHQTTIYTLVLWLAKLFENTFFIPYLLLYFITTYFFYLGVYLLSYQLFKNRLTAIISCALFIVPYPVAGAAITTIEKYFTARWVAETLFLYLLLCLCQQKYKWTFLLLGLIILVHPLSAASFFILIFFLLLINHNQPRVSLYKGLIPVVLTGLVVTVSIFSKIPTLLNTFFVSHEWLEVLKLRNAYAFPILWSVKSWMYFFGAMMPLGIRMIHIRLFKMRLSFIDKVTYRLLTISLFVLLFQVVFTSFYPISWVIILQLGRIWWTVILFSFLIWSNYLSKLIWQYKIPDLSVKIFLLLILILSLTIRNKDLITLQNPSWIDSQNWVKQHTNTKCTVLVDFYSQGFRVYSQRQIIGEYKDGTLSFYSPEFASAWNKKRNIFNRAEEIGLNQYLDQIYNQHPFSLIVVSKNVKISMSPIYYNDSYFIYKWSKLEKDCQITI